MLAEPSFLIWKYLLVIIKSAPLEGSLSESLWKITASAGDDSLYLNQKEMVKSVRPSRKSAGKSV